MKVDNDMFEDLFERAVELEQCAGARVVACLTNGRAYTYGYGQKKTHPFQKKFGRTEEHIYLHAEIDAIKNWLTGSQYFGNRLEELTYCELYVMRVKKVKGVWITGLSIPCAGCIGAIDAFGIEEVYYTEDNASWFTCL
jgi:tRNA(Arg) A34 adenosine deaminase TadA